MKKRPWRLSSTVSARKCSRNCRWNSPSRPRRCWRYRWKGRWGKRGIKDQGSRIKDQGSRIKAELLLPFALNLDPQIRFFPARDADYRLDSIAMLNIKNLHVAVGGEEIIKGLDLDVGPGELHAIMGPNGSGKSTLGYALAGRDGYEVTDGSVDFAGQDLLELEVEQRAAAGLFLALQYPVEIPGVNNAYFLRAALNAQRKARGEEEVDSMTFLKSVREQLQQLKMDEALLKRAVNEGFSGGEKKRNEIVQLAVLQPKLAILDETDSGLDIDALKLVAEGVNRLRDENRSFVVITHYQRLLEYLVPDRVHVLSDGRIAESGDRSLAQRLEREGYAFLDTAEA